MTSVSRSRVVRLLVVTALASAALAATAAAEEPPSPFRALPETEATAVRLTAAGSYESGLFDESAAEITAFDPGTDRLFVVKANSGSVDVLDVSDPTAPVKVATLAVEGSTAADGSTVPADSMVNSVDVYDGTLAVAVESPDKVGLWTGAAAPGMGDLGAEGVEFIAAQDSPTGAPLLAVANEVSGTTTLFDITTVTPGRLGGADRYDTAARISEGYPKGVDTAYVASGEVFPDALVGAALAGTDADPVLPSRTGEVPAVTSAALRWLRPKAIVLLGGERALSGAVADEPEAIAPVSRLAGANRYATAAAVSSRFPDPSRAFVASGMDLPDALAGAAGAAVAGAQGAPVLLTDPEDLSPETVVAQHDMAPDTIVVLGGPLGRLGRGGGGTGRVRRSEPGRRRRPLRDGAADRGAGRGDPGGLPGQRG